MAPIPTSFEEVQIGDISPNGSELLIFANTTEEEAPLFILPLPAGLPRRVGDIVGHDAGWAPNGLEIVYARGNDLYTAKRDGSDSHRLVTLPSPASYLRWSPDGKLLRFTVNDPKT